MEGVKRVQGGEGRDLQSETEALAGRNQIWQFLAEGDGRLECNESASEETRGSHMIVNVPDDEANVRRSVRCV